jgi:hypothetical protein
MLSTKVAKPIMTSDKTLTYIFTTELNDCKKYFLLKSTTRQDDRNKNSQNVRDILDFVAL